MNILIINDYKKLAGGAETFIHNLKSFLEKEKNKVEIMGSENDENFSSFFSRWYSLKWYKKVRKKIKEFNPDIIHINNCVRIISPSVIKASLKSKVPIIFTFHDFYYFCPSMWSINKKNIFCDNGICLKCLAFNCPEFKIKKNILRHLLKFLRVLLHRRIIKSKKILYISPSESGNQDLCFLRYCIYCQRHLHCWPC